MPRPPRRTRRSARSTPPLAGAAAGALVMGLALLVLPLFLQATALDPLLRVLRPLGWTVLVLGLALVGLSRWLRTSRASARATLSREGVPPGGADRRASARGTTAAAQPRTFHPPPRLDAWSPAVFAAIEWRRFEAVCETLFAQAGFRTRSQSHGADGGVDVWMFSDHAEGPVSVAQCKHWRNRSVGVRELREFFGVMASHGLRRGTFVTTSIFTSEAMNFSTENGINAIDGNRLLRLIGSRSPLQQQALLAVAYEGDFWRPTCVNCGTKMVERASPSGKAPFWGCTGYPRCTHRMAVAAAA